MRIAVISYRLPIEGEKRGGIERVAHVLADGLSRRGHTVTVFSHDPRPAGASYDVQPLPWKSFVDTWAGLRMTAGYLGNILALQVDVREFDAVIAHGDSLLLSLSRKPVLRVMHGSALREARHASSVGRAIFLFHSGHRPPSRRCAGWSRRRVGSFSSGRALGQFRFWS